jgi:hypothetical protein
MELVGWNLTIGGAALCAVYGWVLASPRLFRRIWVSRIGIAISIVGLVVLVAMAVEGPAGVENVRSVITPTVLVDSGSKYPLTMQVVADQVGFSPSTVGRWIIDGKVDVPRRKNMSGDYRFSERDLRVLLEYAKRTEIVEK